MSRSTWLRTSGPGEACDVNVDGFGVDYSFLPEDDPERTLPIVTLYVAQQQKIGGAPVRHNTVNMTVTPEEAEALALALIVQAANARRGRDELVANRSVVREVTA